MNKNIYVSSRDKEFWDRADTYAHLSGMSLSQFLTILIKKELGEPTSIRDDLVFTKIEFFTQEILQLLENRNLNKRSDDMRLYDKTLYQKDLQTKKEVAGRLINWIMDDLSVIDTEFENIMGVVNQLNRGYGPDNILSNNLYDLILDYTNGCLTLDNLKIALESERNKIMDVRV